MEPVPFVDLEPWVEKVRNRMGRPLNVVEPLPKLLEALQCFEDDVETLLTTNEFLGGGPTTKKLEAALATKLGIPYVVTCANGTDALQLALRACGVDRGSRVAIPNLTFWATYEAVVNVGAVAVLIDIDPDDRQMSFEDFKRAHDAKQFDAAILVHLYGWCSSRLAEFRAFCREHRITLIEDGAQAFGVEVDIAGRRSVFADADVATLSFHPAKVLGGIGDGGAVLTRSHHVAATVRSLANHGRTPGMQHEHYRAGWNSRMDAIQAAWLLRALDVIDEVVEARRGLRDLYITMLSAYVHAPDRTHSLVYPGIATNGYMTTLMRTNQAPAEEVVTRLATQGIEARRIYPLTIANQAGRNAIQFGPLSHSRALVEHVISLPLYYGMTTKAVERCVKAYVEAVK